MRCYIEEIDFDPEALGDEAWLTGCPLCGMACGALPRDYTAAIDAELNAITRKNGE